MFIPKKIFVEIGLFDEDFFMYYEETELTTRLNRSKYKVFIIPEAKIIHYGQVNEMTPKKIKIYFTSKFLYFKKTQGYFSYIFVKY